MRQQKKYAWKTVQNAREAVATEEQKLERDLTAQQEAATKLEELRTVRCISQVSLSYNDLCVCAIEHPHTRDGACRSLSANDRKSGTGARCHG